MTTQIGAWHINSPRELILMQHTTYRFEESVANFNQCDVFRYQYKIAHTLTNSLTVLTLLSDCIRQFKVWESHIRLARLFKLFRSLIVTNVMTCLLEEQLALVDNYPARVYNMDENGFGGKSKDNGPKVIAPRGFRQAFKISFNVSGHLTYALTFST